jgi:dipeptidyl aminopeptidase/acylaminoacyl peptidase
MILVTSFQRDNPAELFKPDGTTIRKPVVGALTMLRDPRVAPDGKRLAVIKLGPIPPDTGPWTPNHLYVFDLDTKEGPKEALVSDMRYPYVAWGGPTKLYVSHIDPAKAKAPIERDKLLPLLSRVYDVTTKKSAPLALPPGHGIIDVSPDGQTLLTVTMNQVDHSSFRSYLIPLATLKPRPLTGKPFRAMRFSPDGKRVLGTRVEVKNNASPPSLLVLTLADGSERTVWRREKEKSFLGACWSPDGKRIAVVWTEEVPWPPGKPLPRRPVGGPPKQLTASRVSVVNADGTNRKTIIRRDYLIHGIDWR